MKKKPEHLKAHPDHIVAQVRYAPAQKLSQPNLKFLSSEMPEEIKVKSRAIINRTRFNHKDSANPVKKVTTLIRYDLAIYFPVPEAQ